MDNHEYELVHHGIPGMKWGIRRYQNRDGTLTNAGKKRYQKELAKVREAERIVKNKEQVKAKVEKLNARKKNVAEREKALEEAKKATKKEAKKVKSTEEVKKSGPKSINELSDQELQQVVTRLNLEKRYQELRPQEKSKGRKFMSGLMDKVVVPAATSVGKRALEDWLGGQVDDLMGKNSGKSDKKNKSDSKPDEPKTETKKDRKRYTVKRKSSDDDTYYDGYVVDSPKKKSYVKPEAQSKTTWVWDDDWWDVPVSNIKSNDNFSDLYGLPAASRALPEPTKKRKKK